MKLLIWIIYLFSNSVLADAQQWPVKITTACYGLSSTFLSASCTRGQHIVVKNVFANAKPRYTNCPEESDDGTPLDPNCCICSPDDCQMEYSGVSKMKYYTECNGQQTCNPRVSWQPIGNMCSSRSYLLRSNYMVLEYYCVGDPLVQARPMNHTEIRNNKMSKSQNHNMSKMSSTTPSNMVERPPYKYYLNTSSTKPSISIINPSNNSYIPTSYPRSPYYPQNNVSYRNPANSLSRDDPNVSSFQNTNNSLGNSANNVPPTSHIGPDIFQSIPFNSTNIFTGPAKSTISKKSQNIPNMPTNPNRPKNLQNVPPSKIPHLPINLPIFISPNIPTNSQSGSNNSENVPILFPNMPHLFPNVPNQPPNVPSVPNQHFNITDQPSNFTNRSPNVPNHSPNVLNQSPDVSNQSSNAPNPSPNVPNQSRNIHNTSSNITNQSPIIPNIRDKNASDVHSVSDFNISSAVCSVSTECHTSIIITIIGQHQCPFQLVIRNLKGDAWFPCDFNTTGVDTFSNVLLIYDNNSREVDRGEPWLQFISSDHFTDVVLTCNEKAPLNESLEECFTVLLNNTVTPVDLIPGLANWEVALLGVAILFTVTFISLCIWVLYSKKKKERQRRSRFGYPAYNAGHSENRSAKRLWTPTNVRVRDQDAGVDFESLPRRSVRPVASAEAGVKSFLPRLLHRSSGFSETGNATRPNLPSILHRPKFSSADSYSRP